MGYNSFIKMNEVTNMRGFFFNNNEYYLLKCVFWFRFVLPQNVLREQL